MYEDVIKYLDGTDYVVSNFAGKKVSEDKIIDALMEEIERM